MIISICRVVGCRVVSREKKHSDYVIHYMPLEEEQRFRASHPVCDLLDDDSQKSQYSQRTDDDSSSSKLNQNVSVNWIIGSIIAGRVLPPSFFSVSIKSDSEDVSDVAALSVSNDWDSILQNCLKSEF